MRRILSNLVDGYKYKSSQNRSTDIVFALLSLQVSQR